MPYLNPQGQPDPAPSKPAYRAGMIVAVHIVGGWTPATIIATRNHANCGFLTEYRVCIHSTGSVVWVRASEVGAVETIIPAKPAVEGITTSTDPTPPAQAEVQALAGLPAADDYAGQLAALNRQIELVRLLTASFDKPMAVVMTNNSLLLAMALALREGIAELDRRHGPNVMSQIASSQASVLEAELGRRIGPAKAADLLANHGAATIRDLKGLFVDIVLTDENGSTPVNPQAKPSIPFDPSNN